MQLADLVIYGDRGQLRRLEFERGALNVITGESQTGKSALIEAIRYCFGSEQLEVPQGVIHDAVAWYGLRLMLDDGSYAFVARPRPPSGQASSNL